MTETTHQLSPTISFQRLGTEKNGLTDEQILERTQQMVYKTARKVKDDVRKPENTILRALDSLSENSLKSSASNVSFSTALRGEKIGQDCLESYGLDSDQQNVIPEIVCSTSAKHADGLSLQERTFPNPLQTKINFTNNTLFIFFQIERI